MTAVQTVRRPGEWLADLARAEGSAGHAWLAHMLGRAGGSSRDMADAVHHLALVHGNSPSIAEIAMRGLAEPAAAQWAGRVAAAFEAERALVAALVVAAGPLPSTPGQAATTSTLAGQRHALAMLAQSNRTGTALGAVLALALDWRALRPLLIAACERFGVAPPPCRLPDGDEATGVAERLADAPGLQRALAFGAQQLLLQQRGLWDLLEARALARCAAA